MILKLANAFIMITMAMRKLWTRWQGTLHWNAELLHCHGHIIIFYPRYQ